MSAAVAIDVLIPTCHRACALAVTLAALSAQTWRDFRIIVSDQSDAPGAFASAEVAALQRYLAATGIELVALRHLPRLGMAEQRAFLLSRSESPYCLFLDDDVIVESDLLARMHQAMRAQQCGLVGSAPHGLSHLAEQRPGQQAMQFWDTQVAPERIEPGSAQWERHRLHRGANLFHVQQQLGLGPSDTRCYRVAWVGGCVLFDAAKLRAAGGFDFWRRLPAGHAGEDVLAQLKVIERFGGCGIIPSGAYHMELPTTIATGEVGAPAAWRP